MSTRDELMVELTMERCSDDQASELLDAYRAEVLREAAEDIRREVRSTARDYDASRWNRVVDLCIEALTP
jgi:hypothetical protein